MPMPVDEARMPLGDHLEELRRTILKCLIAIGVTFVGCFGLAREPLMKIVVRPHAQVLDHLQSQASHVDAGDASDETAPDTADPRVCVCECAACARQHLPVSNLQALTPQARFVAYLKVSVLAAVLVSLPILSLLIWNFIGAGLYPHERRWVYWIAPFSTLLFLAGVCFAYFVLLPFALLFLLTYGNAPIDSNPDLTSYLSFFLGLELLMGFVFQIPLVSLFLQSAGILPGEVLRRHRRHALVGMFVVAAVFTPPDWVTLLVVAGPMIILYELGILAGRIKLPIGKRKDS